MELPRVRATDPGGAQGLLASNEPLPVVDLWRLREGTHGFERGAQVTDSVGVGLPGDPGVPNKTQGPRQGLVRNGIGS